MEIMVAEAQIRFEDGESYEQYMGDWSQRVGKAFLGASRCSANG